MRGDREDINLPTRRSGIRRRPEPTDRQLADAIDTLHEHGPRIILELQDEIDRLREELREAETSDVNSERGRELVALLRE